MKKTELIDIIAEKTGITKVAANEAIDTIQDVIIDEVKKGNTVRLSKLGVFKPKHTKARVGVNPQNPSEKIDIPAKDSIGFKVSSSIKKEWNK